MGRSPEHRQSAVQVETVAIADDREDANGETVLDFWQTQEVARAFRPGARGIGAYTVAKAIADYLEHREGRASHYEASRRFRAHVLRR